MLSDEDTNDVLCDGLRWLSPPAPSSDFDDRVIAALRQPGSCWQIWLRAAQPALYGMCCSVLVTLAVIYVTLHGPETISMPAMPHTRIDMAVVDIILDEPHLRADSLEQLSRLSAATSTLPVGAAHRPPDIRRAWLPTKTLVA